MRTAVLTLLSVGLLGPSADAQPPAEATGLLATLAKLEKDSWEAMRRQDTKFFRGFMADDFTGVFADGLAVTKKDFVELLGEYELSRYEMGEAKLLSVGPDAAFVLYRVKYEGTFKGQKVKVAGAQASSLYVRRGGKWVELFYQETEIAKK